MADTDLTIESKNTKKADRRSASKIAQDKIKSEHWRDAHGVKIQKNINHKLGAKAEGVTRMKVLESIVLDIQRYRELLSKNVENMLGSSESVTQYHDECLEAIEGDLDWMVRRNNLSAFFVILKDAEHYKRFSEIIFIAHKLCMAMNTRFKQSLYSDEATHTISEATFRASVDGLIEFLWAGKGIENEPLITLEARFRVRPPMRRRAIVAEEECKIAIPDLVLGTQCIQAVPNSKDGCGPPYWVRRFSSEELKRVAEHVYTHFHSAYLILNRNLNAGVIERKGRTYQIDIYCLAVEYKKDDSTEPGNICQLSMAMSCIINQLYILNISGNEIPVFGLLIQRNVAKLYVGWMECGKTSKENMIHIQGVDGLNSGATCTTFDLSNSYDTLRFAVLLDNLKEYSQMVAQKVEENLILLYKDIIRSNGKLHNDVTYLGKAIF